MSTSEIQIKARTSRGNPVGLGLFLSGMALLSILILTVDSRGLLNMLGWRKSPGYLILFLLLALAVLAIFRRASLRSVVISSTLLAIPVCLDLICDFVRRFVDIFPLPSALWLSMAFLPILIGCSCVYRMTLPMFAKVGYLIVAAYIGSVHLFNELNSEQHMGFFGGGWIV